MSWQDRGNYQRPDDFGSGSGIGMGFPKPTPVVKYLLIANIAIFVVPLLFRFRGIFELYFALPGSLGLESFLQPWRLISYQFLHGTPTHLLFNMLGLYFFGPALERYWGPKQFTFFYLFCGIVGGLAFIALSTIINDPSPIIGASGAILGLLAACALLFPQMIIILLVFPVPIRFAAILLAGIYGLNVLFEQNLSDACHLAGMAAAVIYIKARPFFQDLQKKNDYVRRERMMHQEQEDKRKVDEILEKVHQQGIQSLSWHEKKVLREATERQKQRDNNQKHSNF
jgi:membrane associated rhomboid family serine protease